MLGTHFYTLPLAVALRPFDLLRLAKIQAQVAFRTSLYAQAASVTFPFIDFDYLLLCFHQCVELTLRFGTQFFHCLIGIKPLDTDNLDSGILSLQNRYLFLINSERLG